MVCNVRGDMRLYGAERLQMKYNSTVLLKNGKACLIRNAEAADAQAVYDIFNLTHGQTDYLLSYPDENYFTVEKEREFLIHKEDSAREIEVCAILDGKIVGTAGIEAVGNKDKVKHRAEFGISVEESCWGLGVGRALIEACIECSKKAGYIQLELNVVAGNVAAISLYESVGFSEFGRNPKGFCSRSSVWQELVLMRLEL